MPCAMNVSETPPAERVPGPRYTVYGVLRESVTAQSTSVSAQYAPTTMSRSPAVTFAGNASASESTSTATADCARCGVISCMPSATVGAIEHASAAHARDALNAHVGVTATPPVDGCSVYAALNASAVVGASSSAIG